METLASHPNPLILLLVCCVLFYAMAESAGDRHLLNSAFDKYKKTERIKKGAVIVGLVSWTLYMSLSPFTE